MTYEITSSVKFIAGRKMEFYINRIQDAAWNLALEETLWRRGRDVFMLWQNAPSVIVGRHQNVLQEVDMAFAGAHGIRIVRRMTGGGAVYHDLGNINFTLALPARPWSAALGEACLAPVRNALRRLGVPDCRISGRNDLLCGDVKVSGCARCVQKNRMLFHGTLLYDTDLSRLGAVLTPDEEKIRSKGILSVRSRVGNLRTLWGGEAPETPEFLQMIACEIAREPGFSVIGDLPEELCRAAGELAETKYRTREWNMGTAFPCDLVRTKRFPAGRVTAELRIRKDRLTAVRFTGDFLGEEPVAELESRLAGTVPEYDFLLEKLRSPDCGRFISGVSAEDLAELLAVGSGKSAKNPL